jgi:hypothetical protein
MGELVAWGLGLGLGYLLRARIRSWAGIGLFVGAAVAIGTLVTAASGESEPWLILLDIGQVLVAGLLGAFAVPYLLQFVGFQRPTSLR